jgi:hypothetical protein
MSAGIPAIAPTPVSVITMAATQASGRPHTSFRSKPKALMAPAIPDETEMPIQLTITNKIRPTTDGS